MAFFDSWFKTAGAGAANIGDLLGTGGGAGATNYQNDYLSQQGMQGTITGTGTNTGTFTGMTATSMATQSLWQSASNQQLGTYANPSNQQLGTYANHLGQVQTLPLITRALLNHEAFDTPVETLVDLWRVKYGEGWVDESDIAGEVFYGIAAQRLSRLAHMEEHQLAGQLGFGNRVFRLVK